MVRLELAGLAPPDVAPPAGIADHARRRGRTSSRPSTPSPSRRSPTSRAATSRWPPATSQSSAPATSTGRDPRRRLRRGRSTPTTGDVVGYANLMFVPGLHDDGVARHDGRRAGRWRGRGLATALKRATIAWAIARRPRGARDRQRRGQRPDARGERAARLSRRSPTSSTMRGPLPPASDDRGQTRRSSTAETQLPPDPDAYDSPRDRSARARASPAPYIAGGDDPDPAAGLRRGARLPAPAAGMVVPSIARRVRHRDRRRARVGSLTGLDRRPAVASARAEDWAAAHDRSSTRCGT